MDEDRRTGLRGWPLLFCALVGGALLALLLFLSWREDYWGDEGFTVRRVAASWTQVVYPLSYWPSASADPFDRRAVFDLNPPLYFVLVRAVAGSHPSHVVLRLFSVVPMIGLLALLVRFGRRRFGGRAAAGMAVVFCLSPAVIYYGHEARPYAMGMLAAMCLITVFAGHRGRAVSVFALHFCAATVCLLLHFHLAWLVLTLAAFHGVRLLRGRTGEERAHAFSGLGGLAWGSALVLLLMLPMKRYLAATVSKQSVTGTMVFRGFFAAFPGLNANDPIQTSLAIAAACLLCALCVSVVNSSCSFSGRCVFAADLFLRALRVLRGESLFFTQISL